MGDPSKEPNAVQRQGATELYGMFNAMILEGFTEMQACIIIGTWLGTAGKS